MKSIRSMSIGSACLTATIFFFGAGCNGENGNNNNNNHSWPDAFVQQDGQTVNDAAAQNDGATQNDAGQLDASSTDDGGVPCAPDWHPFGTGVYCSDCSSMSTAYGCYQNCTSCPDGKVYRAECNETTGVCSCLIDGVEVCTCNSTYPVSSNGCQPEEWLGANCCWNAG